MYLISKTNKPLFANKPLSLIDKGNFSIQLGDTPLGCGLLLEVHNIGRGMVPRFKF